MKKSILSLLSVACAASFAHASLILSNSFDYADGALTANSTGSPLGVWTAHSGAGAQAVQVLGGSITLVTASGSAEDVSTVLTNAAFPSAFTTETLYVSFKVKFSVLPTSGTSTYFAHFRDNATAFRARVFSTTSGAGAGKYRVGITSSSSSAYVPVPTDLELGEEYKLVIRFEGSTNATLWVKPTSEASIVSRADATDTTSLGAYYSLYYSFRQATGMGTLTVDDLLIGTTFADVQTIGGPPSISGLVDVHMPWNTNSGNMAFLVSDVETPAGSLTVAATSDNPTLVPNTAANLTFGGSAGNRTLKVAPASGQQGTAGIEVVVTDGNGDKATNSFKVYVGEPTISTISGQLSPTNVIIGPIAFTVTDIETPGGLTVTPASSNEGVVPTANIQVLGTGASRTVRVTPLADTSGTATITLTVKDGTWEVPTSFKVTFYPKFGLVLGDTFTYDDGSVTTNSGAFWFTHSGGTGTTGQTQVINGKVALSSAQGEDISAGFTNFYQNIGNGIVLYSSFKVNFTSLPTGNNGNHFAHYRDSSVSNLKGRVFAATNGAAPGKFRIHVSNGGFVLAGVPQDLSTNTTYLVLTRYNVDTAESTVWVNPTTETAGGATAIDSTTPVIIYYFAFRQDTGIGALTVDDLKVGSQWSDVWEEMAPAPEMLVAQQSGSDLVLSWTNPAFKLESATEVTGTFSEVSGATSPYTNTLSAPRFFRLKY